MVKELVGRRGTLAEEMSAMRVVRYLAVAVVCASMSMLGACTSVEPTTGSGQSPGAASAAVVLQSPQIPTQEELAAALLTAEEVETTLVEFNAELRQNVAEDDPDARLFLSPFTDAKWATDSEGHDLGLDYWVPAVWWLANRTIISPPDDLPAQAYIAEWLATDDPAVIESQFAGIQGEADVPSLTSVLFGTQFRGGDESIFIEDSGLQSPRYLEHIVYVRDGALLMKLRFRSDMEAPLTRLDVGAITQAAFDKLP
jgi:hypothetical protein